MTNHWLSAMERGLAYEVRMQKRNYGVPKRYLSVTRDTDPDETEDEGIPSAHLNRRNGQLNAIIDRWNPTNRQ